MRIAALVLVMVLWTPQGGETNLGDFGTITYTDSPPDIARIEATIRFVFSLFPDVDIPDTRVAIMPLAAYEEYIAQMEAGPNWRHWLRTYRAQTQWTVAATTDRYKARDGTLEIMTFTELPDIILIHECLHFIFMQIEPSGFDDHPILNTEAAVRAATSSVLVSKRYRAYLRQRPWVK